MQLTVNAVLMVSSFPRTTYVKNEMVEIKIGAHPNIKANRIELMRTWKYSRQDSYERMFMR